MISVTWIIVGMVTTGAILFVTFRSKQAPTTAQHEIPVMGTESKPVSTPVEVSTLTHTVRIPSRDPLNLEKVQDTLRIHSDDYIPKLRCPMRNAVVIDCGGDRRKYRRITRHLGARGIKHRCLPRECAIVLSRQYMDRVSPLVRDLSLDFQNLREYGAA